jgi:uncharacterized CHY-type Zn-finger protein
MALTREQAIAKLESLIDSVVDREMIDESCHEVIEYLEAQEPVEPKRHAAMWYCGNCDSKLVRPHYTDALYCWRCGKPVKWK